MLPVERWALACPALPSCGLALTEAERVQGDIVGAIAARLRRWGLEQERLSIRITGCPNGCARPYSGDIGIVGRVPGSYSLYVGGDFEGTRLNQAIAERLDIAGLADALDPLFALFAASRRRRRGVRRFLPPHRHRRAATGRRRHPPQGGLTLPSGPPGKKLPCPALCRASRLSCYSRDRIKMRGGTELP